MQVKTDSFSFTKISIASGQTPLLKKTLKLTYGLILPLKGKINSGK